MLCPTHTCHQSPIYHRGLLNALSNVGISSCTHIPLGNAHLPSCTHIPPGPSAAIIRPYTTGALLTVFCPKLTYHHAPPYHRGLLDIALSNPTCHHAAIYHWGFLLPSFTHNPPGPCERCFVQSSHIIMHPHTTGACRALLCLIPHAIMQTYTTGAF